MYGNNILNSLLTSFNYQMKINLSITKLLTE
jgi:hypothetical protein